MKPTRCAAVESTCYPVHFAVGGIYVTTQVWYFESVSDEWQTLMQDSFHFFTCRINETYQVCSVDSTETIFTRKKDRRRHNIITQTTWHKQHLRNTQKWQVRANFGRFTQGNSILPIEIVDWCMHGSMCQSISHKFLFFSLQFDRWNFTKNCLRFDMGPLQSTRTQIHSKMQFKLLFYSYMMACCLWICIGGDVGNDFSKIQFSNLPAETQDWGSWRLQSKKMMANVTNYFFSILFEKGLVNQ